MTSSDHIQLSTAINRLRQVGDFLLTISNPITMIGEIISSIHTLTSIFRDVPGSPDGIDGLGGDFRKMATALDTAGADIDAVKSSVPSIWQGDAATEAVAALQATHDLLQQAAPAMRKADTLVQEYADEVRRLKRELGHHRQRLAEAVSQLDSKYDILRNLWDTMWPFDHDGGIVDEIRKALGAIDGAVEVFEQLQTASDTLRRGLRDVQGKARAGAIRSRHVDAFDAVLLADAGIGDVSREENGILTTAQPARAAARMDALSDADLARMRRLLESADSEAERAYLMKALAAGHSIDDIGKFAGIIHDKSEYSLSKSLSLINPGSLSKETVSVSGVELEQQNKTTCGSMSIIVARAMNDPLYALGLTTDEKGDPLSPAKFRENLISEQNRVHDATNTGWPQRYGTTPWGLSDELNRHAGSFGAAYDWRFVDDTSAGSVNRALDDAVGAVDAGHPVPVLLGDSYPSHYALLVGHESNELVFYNPTGKMIRLSEDDFRKGDVSALGPRHVQGVVIPR